MNILLFEPIQIMSPGRATTVPYLRGIKIAWLVSNFTSSIIGPGYVRKGNLLREIRRGRGLGPNSWVAQMVHETFMKP
jgi:hypothetical protein